MRQSFQPLSRLAVASFAWLAVARAGAQLAVNSPFLPANSAASTTAPTAGAPLEFRGLIDTPTEGVKVRIYDPNPNRKIGFWLRVNEHNPNCDFVVKQYDRARGTVSVEYHGQTLVLAQKEAKVTSMGTVGPNIAMGGIPLPSAAAQGAAPNPTPAEEQQRLEAVAAEVARRRQLREQTVDQVNPGAPAAQPSVPGPPRNNPQSPGNAPRGAAARGRGPGSALP